MKKILILFLLLLSAPLFAEYGSYQIQFTLEDVNRNVSKGYCQITASYLNLDSLENSEYLKKTLSCQITQDVDTFYYYKARLKYEYQNLYDSSVGKSKIYSLLDETAVSMSAIKTIKIDDMIGSGYSNNILNELKLSDTTWMKIPHVSRFITNGVFCSFEVFVHKKSKKDSSIENTTGRKTKRI
jgi:hypothetical protein